MAKTDGRYDSRLHKATLEEFLDISSKNKVAIKDKSYTDLNILNFLDIPLDGVEVRSPIRCVLLYNLETFSQYIVQKVSHWNEFGR